MGERRGVSLKFTHENQVAGQRFAPRWDFVGFPFQPPPRHGGAKQENMGEPTACKK